MNDAKQETVAELLSRWGPTASGTVCDLCSASLQGVAIRISNGEFRSIVAKGYNPFARGRVDTGMFQALGLTGDPFGTWKEMTVLADTTDWGLRTPCATDVAEFLTT